MEKTETAMKDARKFTMDTLWVAVSQVIIRFRGLLTAPFLISAYGSFGYGILAQMGVTTGLLSHILGLRLPAACVRFLSSKTDDKQDANRAMGSMMTATLAINILMCIVAYSGNRWFSSVIFDDPKHGILVLLTFLWIAATTLFELLLSYLRSMGKIKTLTVLQLFLAATAVVLITALTTARFSLQSVILFLVGSELFFCLLVLFLINREIGFPRPNFGGIGKYLAFSIPLIPLGLIRWVVDSSDRYFVTHILDLSQTGIYSFSYGVGGIISVFSFPLFFVLFPTVSKYWDYKDYSKVRSYFSYSTSFFLLFSLPASAMLYFFSEPLLAMILPSEFVIRPDLIFLIALSTVMSGVFQINVYIVYLTGKTHMMLLVFLLGAGINILLNIMLIPVIGISGAAISTFIAYFALCLVMSFWGRRLLQYPVIDIKFVVKMVIATLIMALWLSSFKISGIFTFMLSFSVSVLILASALFFMKIFSKDEIGMFKEMFLKK
jgi:O-antigen/teichoic acid export membrane protein